MTCLLALLLLVIFLCSLAGFRLFPRVGSGQAVLFHRPLFCKNPVDILATATSDGRAYIHDEGRDWCPSSTQADRFEEAKKWRGGLKNVACRWSCGQGRKGGGRPCKQGGLGGTDSGWVRCFRALYIVSAAINSWRAGLCDYRKSLILPDMKDTKGAVLML